MMDLTCCLIESKLCTSCLDDVDRVDSAPSDDTKLFMTSSGTTPAISWISRGVIDAGGIVEEESLDAD